MKTELRNLREGLSSMWMGIPTMGYLLQFRPTRGQLLGRGLAIDTHPGTPLGWLDLDTFDYSTTDRKIRSYLEKKHDALLIVRFC